ncbi:MAG: T9SS type A sorting domain-containing protein, partial [Chitinispirillaceae bacterium]|nr:T9SS type A sorting domain-containing protein [Chitinispirillaceae bacterium]
IPPILPSMVKTLAKSAKEHASSWSTKFIARSDNGSRLPAVYFGYAPGIKKSAYPLSPSFAALRLAIFDRTTASRYGHHIGEDAKGGLVKELLLSNNADSAQTIHYHLEQAGEFPENYSAHCFDAVAKTLDTNGTIAIAPKSSASRWIITGDAAYRKHFLETVLSLRFALHPLYPNPARSVVNIRYAVPFGCRERIRIVIFNVVGKRVWEKSIDGLLAEGAHTVTWNGRDAHGSPVGSGLYIVRLTALDSRGAIVKRLNRRVTWMR